MTLNPTTFHNDPSQSLHKQADPDSIETNNDRTDKFFPVAKQLANEIVQLFIQSKAISYTRHCILDDEHIRNAPEESEVFANLLRGRFKGSICLQDAIKTSWQRQIMETAFCESLDQISNDDAKQFFQTYYHYKTSPFNWSHWKTFDLNDANIFLLKQFFSRFEPEDHHLFFTANIGDTEKVKYILEKHPGCDVDKWACDKQTPLEAACIAGNLEVAQLLYSKGATTNWKESWGYVFLNKKTPRAIIEWLASINPDLLKITGPAQQSALETSLLIEDFDRINLLVELGLDVQQCRLPSGISLLETIFSSWREAEEREKEEKESIFKTLTSHLSTLPEGIIDKLFFDYVNGDETTFPYLQKFASKRLEVLPPTRAKDSLPSQLMIKIIELREQLKRHNLDPMNITLELLHECHLLKKDVKKARDPSLTMQYTEFCALYDDAIDKHSILSEVRKVSRDLRNFPDLLSIQKQRLLKFYALWGASANIDRISNVTKLNLIHLRRDFPLIRARIIKAFAEGQLLPSGRWSVHGTKSFAASMASQTGQALKSAGALMREGFAPIGGELYKVIEMWNKLYVSFIPVDSNWEAPRIRWFENPMAPRYMHTRFSVAENYARRTFQPTPSGIRPLESTEEDLWQKIKQGIRELEAKKPLSKIDAFDLKVAALRLRQKNRSFLDDARVKRLIAALPSDDEELRGILTTPPPQYIEYSGHPFPVVFASHNAELIPLMINRNGRTEDCPKTFQPDKIDNEVIYLEEEGMEIARFGKEIQFAFTDPEYVHELETILSHSDIRILPMDVGHFVEMRSMVDGSKILEMKRKSCWERTLHDFHRVVAPFYVAPFPENPSYRNEEGIQVKLFSPHFPGRTSLYTEYKDQLEKGMIRPRIFHDEMHAARVAFLSVTLQKLYQKAGREGAEDPYALMMAAGMHDAARQDEGEDRWDGESADLFRAEFKERLPKETIDCLHFALANKDPKGEFTYDVQRIIHDADALDIMRIIMSPGQFEPKRLQFYHFDALEGFDKDAFIAEVHSFIQITEDQALKRHLAENSQNYLGDIVKIFKYVHTSKPMKHMNDLLEFRVDDEPLDDELLTILGKEQSKN
ncbi:MAG: hypothetical protein K940chlam7_01321 [Chlamydiae bacterium]|nr:hypothetical protein [Chlamydiota bacterium]